jgi:hypothetical protein
MFSKADQLQNTKTKKRKKNSPRKILENKLDTLSAKLCRMQGYCTICGKSDGVLNAHHYKSRVYKGVRWYQPNLICLCVHHHTFDFKFSAHKTPEAFKARMLELRGKNWEKDIEKRANEHTSWKSGELEELLTNYQQKIKEL